MISQGGNWVSKMEGEGGPEGQMQVEVPWERQQNLHSTSRQFSFPLFLPIKRLASSHCDRG